MIFVTRHSAIYRGLAVRQTFRSLLDETDAPMGVQQKLTQLFNDMNVYGSSSLRPKQQANSKLVKMLMRHEQPEQDFSKWLFCMYGKIWGQKFEQISVSRSINWLLR
jgi:hypothetical protein